MSVTQIYLTEKGPGVQLCWACNGQPYHVVGHHLIAFEPGDVVVELGKGAGSFRIVKRERGGVDVLESVTTGKRHDMNNSNNSLYIPESAIKELAELRQRVVAANKKASAFALALAGGGA